MTTTSLRTISRVSGALAVMLAAAAALVTFVVPPAGALARPGITLTEDEIKEVAFPGIAGNNPANDLHTPEQCNISAYCDTIPVTIVRPVDFDDTQDYFVQFQMTWDTQKIPSVLEPSGEMTVNDMDMFIYNDPIQEDAGEDQDGVISSGGTQSEPEIAYLSAPAGNYSIVVVNFAGVNRGYTIKLTWVSETIRNPFESLAPGYRPPTPTQPATLTPARPAVPVGGAFEAPPLAAPSLTPALDAADAAFDSGFEDSDFGATLAAPALVDFAPASVEKPAPPSGLAVVLWMLVLPLAVTAFGGTLLSRRSASLLRV